MSAALRWTRLLLLGDLGLIAMIIIMSLVARSVITDALGLKWHVVGLGGVLVIIGGLLSVAALALQVAVALRRRAGLK